MKVLIVEDNERNLRLVRDVLTHAGFVVVAAASGEEGVSLALSERVDAVLMDINLPGMSGVEALGALRAAGFAGPVCAVTAYAMKDDRVRLLAAGFDDYLEKPVDVRSLPGQVSALVAR